MLKIVVFIDWYKPAYKAGGPISSIYNLIELLGDEMEFYVVTSDRDLNEQSALEGLKYNQWVDQGKAKVRYLRENQEKRRVLKEIVEQLSPDRIYLNGIFSYFYSVLPLFLFRNYHIIISPRGMLINEALKIKSSKKRCFLLFMKWVKGYQNVIWQFSNEEGIKEQVKRIPPKWFVDGDKAKNYYLCENAVKNISEETARNALIAMRDWSGLENLKKIKNKTLIIWGDKDKSYNFEQVSTLKNNIPDSDLKIFKNCCHNVHLEQPQKFNQVVEDFLI